MELPSEDLVFTLTEDMLKRVLRAASILTLDNVTVFSEDGGLYFGVSDPKQKNSESFSIRISDYDGPEVSIVVSIQMLDFLPGDYEVTVSHQGNISLQFRNTAADVRYWLAAETDSYVKD